MRFGLVGGAVSLALATAVAPAAAGAPDAQTGRLQASGAAAPTLQGAAARLAATHDAILADLTPHDVSVRAYLGLGLPRFRPDDRATLEADARWARSHRTALAAIDPATLDPQQRLTWAFLDRMLTTIENRPALWRTSFPVTPYTANFLHQPVLALAAEAPLQTAAQRADYLASLESYGRLIRSQGAKLDTQAAAGIRLPRPAIPGARTVMDNYAAAAAMLVPAESRLAHLPAAERAAFRDQAAALVRTDISPAFLALRDRLDQSYAAAAPAAVGLSRLPGGEAAYRILARESTGTDLTPKEIHAIGLRIMADGDAELTQIWKEVGFSGTRTEFARQLSADPRFAARTPADIEALFRRHMARIEPLLPRYFERLPKAGWTVERAPPHVEQGMTYGFYRLPTPGQPVGAYVYNGSDPAARNYANAAALIYHELLPGHHLHGALQQENTALPLLRRVGEIVPVTAYTEGWAEYAADLAGEMGLYDTPYDRYGRLVMRLFLGNRLVVDTGLNALGWSLDDARAYMKANTFASDAEIESELLRYSTDLPGQALAYAIGSREFHRIRAEAEDRMGPTFSLPAFHTAVLETGSVPMDLLDAHVRLVLPAPPPSR
ncbi:MAG: DUF885 domain-containing protein [Sandaracinobacter sp.]